MNWLKSSWQKLAVYIPVAVTVGIFLTQRSAELRWKRTEFLFAQAQYLDSDPDMKRIVAVLEERVAALSVTDLLADPSPLRQSTRKEYLAELDKFLNFFDRLYFAVYSAKTLDIEELSVFGWYLDLIQQDENLVKYCKEKGFADVLTLAADVTKRRTP